jgi:hypothetical protein
MAEDKGFGLSRGCPNTLSKSAGLRSTMSATVRDLRVVVKAVRVGRRRTPVNETRFETAGRDPGEATADLPLMTVADAQVGSKCANIVGCLRLRYGVGGCRRCRHGCRQTAE